MRVYLSAAGLGKRCAWLEIPGSLLAFVRREQLVKSRRLSSVVWFRSGVKWWDRVGIKAGRSCDERGIDEMVNCNNEVNEGVGCH